MSDRLAELVRQRALVQEHLAWLNREIAAAATAAKSAAAAGSASPAPTPDVDSGPLPSELAALPVAATTLDADEIISRYQPAPAHVKQDVRKGCLLYFAAAFVLLGLVVTVLYFMLSNRS